MDRDMPNYLGVLAAKPNGNANGNRLGGKTSTQPFGNRRTTQKNTGKLELKENNTTPDTDTSTSPNSRHPLYTSPKYIPHSNSFSASTNISPESPRETRIPRPSSTVPVAASPDQRNKQGIFRRQSLDMRRPLSIKSAFALAQKQEGDDQPDDTFNIQDAFNIASAEMNRPIDGSPSPAPRNSHLRRQSYNAVPQRTLPGGPSTDLEQHLRQFDRTHQLAPGSRPLNGLFNNTRVGPKISEAGNVLSRRGSDNNFGASPARRRGTQRETGSQDERPVNTLAPIPSIEYNSTGDKQDDQALPDNGPAHPSPDKSYNWQLDADFTAGDLQISNSPRIRTAEQFDKRSSRRPSSTSSSPVTSTPNFRRRNNMIDQIRQKEIDAAKAVPSEEDVSSARRNSRLDEVRVREIESLSKRAVATSRLDEIRVRNSEARSDSPETSRSSNKENSREGSPQLDNEPTKTPESKAESEVKGVQTLDIPVTISQTAPEQDFDEAPNERKTDPKTADDKKDSHLQRSDSYDLLRRLARATSDSPSTEKTDQHIVPVDPPPKEKTESRESSRARPTREERKARNLEVKNLEAKSSRERPTVGFAGLQRVISSDCIQEKRTSMPGSEADPTDRIEAEMKLFAPLDNYSEKGSVRAPSPIPSEPAEEETPRPNKVDPLTQPTPRVSGAYVETPATVKVKQEVHSDEKEVEEVSDNPSQPLDTKSEPQSKTSSDSVDEDSIKQEEDGDTRASRRTSIPRSSSVPTTLRRSRSASRHRRPLRPLINTAKPPSVKDDIRAILHTNEIDDSSLDDFDSILADQQIDDEELQQMVDDTMHKIDNDLELPGLSERDRELEIYDRMSKSLKTGLLGIRSAKKGIERLEDKVMHTEYTAGQAHADLNTSSSKPEVRIPADPSDSASSVVSLPALYQKSPKPRPTKLGVLALAVLIWYILESIFCSLYITQYDCTPQLPCEWSPNEPYFPYAMPFMLDEWTTGGKGRALTWKIGEEVGDVLAEVSDWVTNTDFTQFDERFMNVWERKRHRRRLRKHGLIPKWVAPPDYQPRFAQWNAARLAREAAIANGEEVEVDDETMSADERIR